MRPRTTSATLNMALAGLASFFECAAYFAFAIQIATTTVLAPIDLETKKSSFGAYEALLAAVVSTMTLLPLTSALHVIPLVPIIDRDNKIQKRQSYRLWLFSVTVVAALYPFFSSCVRYWAPSVVGEGAGEDGVTYVTDAEWAAITHVCFGQIVQFPSRSNVEGIALGVIHLTSGFFIFFYAASIILPSILRIVDAIITRGQGGGILRQGIRSLCQKVSHIYQQPSVMYLMVAVPLCLGAGLMWAFWMLRKLQQQLASTAGGSYEGNEWGFGQVMAITVFVPVGAEMLFVAYHYQWRGRGSGLPIDVQLGDVSVSVEEEAVPANKRAMTSHL